MPFVHIVILNYKNWRDVTDCLRSVFLSDYQSFRVYVVDNHSENGSLEEIMRWVSQQQEVVIENPLLTDSERFHRITDPASLPSLVCIQHGSNDGFAAGNNVALRVLRKAEGYIWLLNPDMILQPGTLSAMVRFAGESPDKAIIGPVIYYQDQPDRVYMYGGGHIHFRSATVRFLTSRAQLPDLDYISGGALFARAETFDRLGLLPENYFLYWEETDWCYAAGQLGYPMLVCDDAHCYDKIGTTVGRGYLAFFYYTRNGLSFVRRFKKQYLALVLSLTAARWAKAMLTGRRDRAKGIYDGVIAFTKLNSSENQ